MTRPEHLAAANVSTEHVLGMLYDLAGVVESRKRRPYSFRPQLADSDDEMVLEAAVWGGADAIVTFEVRTFSAAAARFGIAVMTPGAAWRRLGS